jgi:predicted nucleic acid-binding protein
MRYVIVSAVAFKWIAPEALKDKAERLRDDFRNAVHELLAPDVFPYEVAHALTRAERQGRITRGQAFTLWMDMMTTVPSLHAGLPLAPRAVTISSQVRVGFYDCLYVALAEQEQCQLVTADDRLVKNLQAQFRFIVPLSALP